MTISYKWLCDYLPVKVEPERLSRILTSIGLEVESMEHYESIKGGLQGLVTGEVLTCEKHPNADKLSVTTVNVGEAAPLQIVCGAPNVAAGQKVIVAKVGATIYPHGGEPITMKVAKIRGTESHGMICAEDEIGLSEDHAGIMILPAETPVGKPAHDILPVYTDHIYEIGLTPNRMDAMSHVGVAKDVCAYLAHHDKLKEKVALPYTNGFKADNTERPIPVTIENTVDCARYCGVTITGVTIGESPAWMQQRLRAIGVRPISNIVDITNYILHETGQPLHAFDADAIKGNVVIVKNVEPGTKFTTLDGKERTLTGTELMICNAEEPMCIGGIFGGLGSGIKESTTSIFLESAWFNPVSIRRSSVQHGLRTDAATRFEKGVDISGCVQVLKRAALMIKEMAGGTIASDIVDVYPKPVEKKQVGLKYHYLKKLSGKNYHPDSIRNILVNLGFEIVKEGMDELWVAVPYSKPDISLQADIVEEIIRIDGLDNIDIPRSIHITPSVQTQHTKEKLKEKLSDYLTGLGFHEILTNSITNSKYYPEEVLNGAVKMINSLSADLDIMKPSVLETALESIAYNLNRKQETIRFFELGKTYSQSKPGVYNEKEVFALFISGADHADGWRSKSKPADFYVAKGLAEAVCKVAGVKDLSFKAMDATYSGAVTGVYSKNTLCGQIREVSAGFSKKFDIDQPVFTVELDFDALLNIQNNTKITYREISKYPTVVRDLAFVVDKSVTYAMLSEAVEKLRINKIKNTRLFDVFESEKLGKDKKSMAMNFTFADEEKTLTDKEIDQMMGKIIAVLEKDFNAAIRK